MTSQQNIAIANVHAKLEAQRERVEQARREQPNTAYLANLLERMGELAQGGYLKESAAMSRRYIKETTR